MALSETLHVIHRVDYIEVLVLVRVENSQRLVLVEGIVLNVNMMDRLQILSRFEQNHIFAVEGKKFSADRKKFIESPHQYMRANTRSSSKVPCVRLRRSWLM